MKLGDAHSTWLAVDKALAAAETLDDTVTAALCAQALTRAAARIGQGAPGIAVAQHMLDAEAAAHRELAEETVYTLATGVRMQPMGNSPPPGRGRSSFRLRTGPQRCSPWSPSGCASAVAVITSPGESCLTVRAWMVRQRWAVWTKHLSMDRGHRRHHRRQGLRRDRRSP
jgi:hypothetical protein